MKILHTMLIALLMSLTGCYTMVTKDNVNTLSDADLCDAYTASASSGRPLTRQEILRRGLLTAEDMNRVDGRVIRAGMPECGLLAMMGYPRPPEWCGRVNVTGGYGGPSKQYVYRTCGGYSYTRYVYVDNGVITSWQNW